MKIAIVWFGLVVSLLVAASHTNALIGESSPYLRRHAHNPVHWYPWGQEAFAKAKREGKPIFLSIGFSTCHWCHVMEEESFEDPQVAALINRYFVAIKVDKEEYPAIDRYYQRLYRRVHGTRGGWPLSVFLTSEGEPYAIATYIPKEAGYGSEGLLTLLPKLAKEAHNKALIARRRAQWQKDTTPAKHRSASLEPLAYARRAVDDAYAHFDTRYGGFGDGKKFPQAAKLRALFDLYRLSDDARAATMVRTTLDRMMRGGVYDQIEGGFFRYTTDREWEYPHFEKMLYTNAELIEVYAKAYARWHDPNYKEVVVESISMWDRYFRSPEGLYYGASDADSMGEEGGYFLHGYETLVRDLQSQGWSMRDIRSALAYYGIEEDGNIDGELSLPHRTALQAPPSAKRLKRYLQTVRATRPFPFVDKKVIVAWNAMMIKALLTAGTIDARYTQEATAALDRLVAMSRTKAGICHYLMDGRCSKVGATMDDYAFTVDALISAYEATYRKKYRREARRWADEALARFFDGKRWYVDAAHRVAADIDERYHTPALTVMIDALMRLAMLDSDQERLALATRMAASLPRTTGALATVRTIVAAQAGYVVIHGSLAALQDAQSVLLASSYPFVLSQPQETEGYLACGMGVCFAQADDLTTLLQRIKRRLLAETNRTKPTFRTVKGETGVTDE